MKARDADKIFNKLQMEERSTDHKHVWLYHEGKKILKTKRSHGKGELKGKVRHFIRQQLYLNEKEFRDLLACPLDRNQYIEILKEKGHIVS